MENFQLHNPVKLYFGKDIAEDLGKVVSKYGKKVLLVYGKGSVKSSGLYDVVMNQLRSVNIDVVEFQGIKSNPIIEDVRKASDLGRLEKVDIILAVGGGSVIDSAKTIAAAIPYNGDPWDFFTSKVVVKEALPMVAVLTLAATGTEMNSFAVVQNEKTGAKAAFGSSHTYPKCSFLDPQYTLTVPATYTAYGIADLMAHVMEQFFGEGDAPLSDRFVYSIMHEGIEAGGALMNDLQNYELRARIMYAATAALNGLCSAGRKQGEWGVHTAGHVLSLLFDTPHGASLTIVYPAWLKLMTERIPDRINELLINTFNTDDIDAGITRLEIFFKSIGCPVRLSEINIGEDKHRQIIDQMVKNKVSGQCQKLELEDYKKLIRFMA